MTVEQFKVIANDEFDIVVQERELPFNRAIVRSQSIENSRLVRRYDRCYVRIVDIEERPYGKPYFVLKIEV